MKKHKMTKDEMIQELDKRDREKTIKIGLLSKKIHDLQNDKNEKLLHYEVIKSELVACKKKITTLQNKLNRIQNALSSSQ